MYTYLVLYKSYLTHREEQVTVPADDAEQAKQRVKASRCVEYIIGDPLKLY